ncbi:hypothetical protein [Litorimonas sp. WD9-15]
MRSNLRERDMHNRGFNPIGWAKHLVEQMFSVHPQNFRMEV